MDNAPASFDWIVWHTTIPGIPAGWGQAPADTAAPSYAAADEPELLAA